MRGEMGEKADGSPRLITAHNTTHLDAPFHFYEQGADIAALLNRKGVRPADDPHSLASCCLAAAPTCQARACGTA